jgi:D-aminoacyl-tRNA deacylase
LALFEFIGLYFAMKAVIQRVSEASVTIGQVVKSAIGKGFMILLGIEAIDAKDDVDWLCQKIVALRIFSDEQGLMNLDIKTIGGEILVVSQFTLHASYKKGNRPSFIKAARPEQAIPLYEYFVQKLSELLEKPVATGTFGADMKVALINDGPVTILMDTQNKE